jgi:hypothetical protein
VGGTLNFTNTIIIENQKKRRPQIMQKANQLFPETNVNIFVASPEKH